MEKRSFVSGLLVRALFVLVFLLGSWTSFVSVSHAAVSSVVNYQARLWSSTGAPVADGTYSMKFSLYTTDSGGTPIWTAKGSVGSPDFLSVTVVNGAMSVLLGDTGQNSLATVDWTQSTIYLGITISPDVAEMSPRRLLAAVPQAFQADNAAHLQGMSASSTAAAGETLFTIHQTDTSSAASARSALDVRSDGTSDTNDYLFRALDNTNTPVFSINRRGAVSSTEAVTSAVGVYAGSGATFYGQNNLTAHGAFTASSTGALTLNGVGGNSSVGIDSQVTIAGQTGIVLNGGTGQIQAATDLGVSLGTASARFNAYLGSVTSTNIATGLVSSTNVLAIGSVTSTIASIGGLSQQVGYTSTLTGLTGRMQIANNRLFVQRASSIEIFDIADPKIERYLGAVSLSGSMSSFTVRGNLLYLLYRDMGDATNRFSVYNVSDPGNTVLLGHLDIDGWTAVVSDIVVNNQFAYVGLADTHTLYTINVSDPSAMVLATSFDPAGSPERLITDGRYLYMSRGNVADPGRFIVYDLADPSLPIQKNDLSLGVLPTEMQQVGSTIYALSSTDGIFTMIDVKNPASPVTIGNVSIGATPSDFVLLGSRLIVGTTDGLLRLFDVSSSTVPIAAGTYTAVVSGQVNGLASTGRSLFVASNAAPLLREYEVPGVTVDAFAGGQGAFYALDVQGNLKIAQNVDVGGSLAVGQGGILSQGGIAATATGTNAFAGMFVNNASSTLNDRSWGLYSNRLLVGENTTATGSKNYVAMFTHDSVQSRFGVCIDDTSTASTCLGFADTSTVYSLLADDAIGANAFDLAERYAISGEASQGDLLVIDPDVPFHMKKSPGVAYDSRVSGVVSTRPGFLLGSGGNASVALVGRVPLNVTVANGAIAVGDALVSSDRPGVAMRASRPGTIIGHALESTAADGRIEVFIQPGFDASGWLQADGTMTQIAQDTGMAPVAQATAEAPAQSSSALSFRGSAWSGSGPAVSEFRLFNSVQAASGSALTVSYGASSTVFSLSQNGSLNLAGDLALAGKLYPSTRGGLQREKYLFVDDSVEGSSYLSTNADGFQSQTGYDYAERYQSPDQLQPGDIVVVRRDHRLYVQRSLDADDLPIGIVSTKPGFVTGHAEEDTYPIALAGRVPTNVSSINGAIEPGDALAPSSIPGVAVKATKPGPIIGLALEEFADQNVGKIEVFVNPTWWGGGSTNATEITPGHSKEGFAEITVGKTRVHVDLTTFVRYPHLQITPYSQMEQGWWIDNVGARGFDIVLGGVIGHNARFSWTATETPDDAQIALSSGRTFALDPISGEIRFPPDVSDQDPPVSADHTDQASPSESAPVPTEATSTEVLPGIDATTTVEEIPVVSVSNESTSTTPTPPEESTVIPITETISTTTP